MAVAVADSAPGSVGSVSLSRADGTVTANWPSVGGATKYHVTYTTNGGSSWHAPVSGHTDIRTNTLTFSANNSDKYMVGVRAGNDHGWSEAGRTRRRRGPTPHPRGYPSPPTA